MPEAVVITSLPPPRESSRHPSNRTNKRLVARKVELGGILVETGLENNEPQQIPRIIAAGKAAINAGPEADDTEQLARIIRIGINTNGGHYRPL